MRQSDGAELLGANDPRSSSIGLIYVDPNDSRQSVLTAILTQDKVGRDEVVVVLPENNRAFQRPVDFDGLKHMRRGLKSEIVFIAPSGPGPAEFARQRRFPVYPSPESFVQSLKTEAAANEGNGKKRGFLFGRKPKPADASAPPPTANGRIEQKPTSPLPVNVPAADDQQAADARVPDPGEDEEITDVPADPNTAVAGMAGAAAGLGLGALLDEQGATLENSAAGSPIDESTLPSSAAVQAEEESNTAGPNEAASREDPGIIRFPAPVSRRPRTTDKLAALPSEPAPVPLVAPVAPAQPRVPTATSPARRGDTGKKAAASPQPSPLRGEGAASKVGAGAALAVRTADGSGTPPTVGGPGGSGGGSGGPGGSRRTRRVLAIVLVILTLLLIAAIAIASNILPGAPITATVTITPVSHLLSDKFIITAVTGTPNPAAREVQARILSATSGPGESTVTSSGSIPGTRATGQLFFVNNNSFAVTFSSMTLRGASGVSVSFNGPVTVPALPPSATVPGFAVNAGAAGNIGALDINGPCCAKGITVRNGTFTGGQDAMAHAIVEQADINAATNQVVAQLKPGTLSALQKQVKSNEAVVPNTLQCPNSSKSHLTPNHQAGDHAPNVTVSGTITCTEEVYDQQAALTMAMDLLKAEARTGTGVGGVLNDFGPQHYALTGNIVTGVTQVTPGSGGTVSLTVSAEGVWVYQFSDAAKKDLAKNIAHKSKQDAMTFLLTQPGVSAVTITISSGTTLPDAAHIKIEIQPVPGAGGTPTTTPSSPTAVPTTPVITPTPGLGGS